MNYLSELRRRNVFRVTIAYLALGWVVVQVTDIVVPALNLPVVLNSIVVYIGIIGFPFALFFAWAFELTPDGVKRTKDVDGDQSIHESTAQKINYAIIVLLSLAVMTLLLKDSLFKKEITDEAVIAEVTLANTIAVMPFTDMSAGGDQEYFGDGIAEEILNVLVAIDSLDVTSSRSSFALTDQNLVVSDIAKQLNVNYIIEGSIRSAGNKIRVTAQLIDVSRDTNMWSDTYDRELVDIFAIQDDISLAIVNALKIELTDLDTSREAPTNNMDAYVFYLQGRKEFMRRGTDDRTKNIGNLRRAITFFEQAVSLDPNFAEAWAELATCTILLPSYGEDSIEDVAPRADEAANKAISINPDLSQAWVVKGIINLSKYRFQDAQTALLRATDLSPNNDTAWLWLGLLYGAVGNQDKAIEAIENAVEIAPAVGVNLSNLGRVYHAKGELDKAISLMDKAINELGYENGRHDRAYMAISNNNPKRAQSEMIEFVNNNYQISGEESDYKLGIYANSFFTPSLIIEAAGLLENDIENDIYQTFFPYFMLQDAEKLIYYFEATKANKGLNLTRIYFPLSRKLFNQRSFKDYIIKIGLLTYWQNNQFPDFCRALGESDFICE